MTWPEAFFGAVALVVGAFTAITVLGMHRSQRSESLGARLHIVPFDGPSRRRLDS